MVSVGLTGCTAVSVTDPQAGNRARATPASSTVAGLGQEVPRATAMPNPIVSKSGTRTLTEELVVVGFASISAQTGGDLAQKRLQAARAAKLDAYRNLAEELYGLDFAGESLVEEGRVRTDTIRARFAGAIAGAEVVSIEPLGSDSYQATVRLPAARSPTPP